MPEPDTEPTNEPNDAAKATEAASTRKRLEWGCEGEAGSAAGSSISSSSPAPSFGAITIGKLLSTALLPRGWWAPDRASSLSPELSSGFSAMVGIFGGTVDQLLTSFG